MKLLLLLLTLGLFGCAAMKKDFVENYCNYDGGYEFGMNDSKRGDEMFTGRFNSCPPNVQAEAKKGYREGYTKATETGATNKIVDGITGAINKMGNATNTHLHRCTGSLLGNKYTATGTTRREAEHRAKNKCKSSSDGIHCHSVIFTCR